MSQDSKLFTCAGVSLGKTGYKVRFANSMSRVKVMQKTGNSDVVLLELPQAMSKSQAVEFLKTTDLMNHGDHAKAILEADVKHTVCEPKSKVRIKDSHSRAMIKAVKPRPDTHSVCADKPQKSRKKTGPSIEEIRSRIKKTAHSDMPADMLSAAIAALVNVGQSEFEQD